MKTKLINDYTERGPLQGELEQPSPYTHFLMFLSFVFFALAILTTAIESYVPLAHPTGTLRSMIKALNHKDSHRLLSLFEPEFYKKMVSFYGARRYEEANHLFEQLTRIAIREWQQMRETGVRGARKSYESLHHEIKKLGRTAYVALSPTERFELIKKHQYESYIYRNGFARLPPEKKKLIPDLEAFRTHADEKTFVSHHLWEFLDENVRRKAKHPNAFADEMTPEKAAFMAELGWEIARPSFRQSHRNLYQQIRFRDLPNRSQFIQIYGATELHRLIKRLPLHSWKMRRPCSPVPQEKARHFLSVRTMQCEIIAGSSSPITVKISRKSFVWRISSIHPWFHEATRLHHSDGSEERQ